MHLPTHFLVSDHISCACLCCYIKLADLLAYVPLMCEIKEYFLCVTGLLMPYSIHARV